MAVLYADVRLRCMWVPSFAGWLVSDSNSLRTVHIDVKSRSVAEWLACRVTVGLAESNGSLPLGLWLTSPTGWLLRTGISSGTQRSVIEYGLPLPFFTYWRRTSAVDVVILWGCWEKSQEAGGPYGPCGREDPQHDCVIQPLSCCITINWLIDWLIMVHVNNTVAWSRRQFV